VLTDFGVVKGPSMGESLTATGQVAGTDLYSLGVMGYAMLSGRLPFPGTTPADVLVQRMTREPEPLLAVAPLAPPALAATIMRCLAKDPDRRWQDARSLRQALHPDEFAPEQPGVLRMVALSTQATLAAVLMGHDPDLWPPAAPRPSSPPHAVAEAPARRDHGLGRAASSQRDVEEGRPLAPGRLPDRAAAGREASPALGRRVGASGAEACRLDAARARHARRVCDRERAGRRRPPDAGQIALRWCVGRRRTLQSRTPPIVRVVTADRAGAGSA
jgi:hypothetical protein